MKKEDKAFYGVMFVSGVLIALFFRKEYLKAKEFASKPKPSGKLVAFGVRG
jgi:hypothetical protein